MRTAISGVALAHCVGHHPVQAGRRQQHGHDGECREHAHEQAVRRVLVLEPIGRGAKLVRRQVGVNVADRRAQRRGERRR
jgi:hypothetical protein